MKRFLTVLCLCYVVSVTRARAEDPTGIKFFTGSWKDVLAEAKRQNKPVFVDLYTTWCGPCKLMAKQAFPDPKVGEKFNASFVNYQIDAEKGEGVDVARMYNVTAYPTSLYVSGDGNLIHRAIGYGGIPGLLAEADKALEAAKDPMPLTKMEQNYKAGKRDPEFLYTYLKKRATIGMPDGEALDTYLKAVPQAEWSSEKNLEVIGGNLTTANTKAFDVLLKELPSMPPSRPKTQLMMELQQLIQRDFKKAVTAKSEAQLEQVIQRNSQMADLFRPQTAKMKQQMADQYRMRFYAETKNVDKYRSMAIAEANRLTTISADTLKAKDAAAYERFQKQTAMMPDSVKQSSDYKKYADQMRHAESSQTASQLNQLAWIYFENMTDPKDLHQALAWSAKSLEYERGAQNLDTYANLLHKLGRKNEAIQYEMEAIADQKAKGEDTTELEKTLAKMKQ